MAKTKKALPPPQNLADAVSRADVAAVTRFLDEGADPNEPSPWGEVPLNVLCQSAMSLSAEPVVAVARVLLERGAKMERADGREQGLFFAAYTGQEELVKLLVERFGIPGPEATADVHLLACAAQGALRWLVERCLREGYAASLPDRYGSTSLHHVVCVLTGALEKPEMLEARVEIAELLLREGCPLERSREGDWGTALHFAVTRGHPRLATLLLDRGADVNARTPGAGTTPLLAAMKAHKKEERALLLARGADVKLADFSGYTPLHAAVATGDAEALRDLLAAGADPAAATATKHKLERRVLKPGTTPRALAELLGRAELVALLPEAATRAKGKAKG